MDDSFHSPTASAEGSFDSAGAAPGPLSLAILVADADAQVREPLCEALVEAGFTVEAAPSGAAALTLLRTRPFQLVLLDCALSEVSGIEALSLFRERDTATPVIVLCQRDSLELRLDAFSKGADDVVAKPFSRDELIARIRAVLRRTTRRASPTLRCGDLMLDLVNRRAVRAGRELRLTGREFALLHFLLEHRGEPQPRAVLLAQIWDRGFDPSSNVLEVYIRHLRKKIDTAHDRPLIRTLRGVGYVLTDAGD